MKQLLSGVALGVATLSLGACATITRGDHTAWELSTSPPGASVITTNNMQCESTPCSLNMPRRSEFDATVTKAGYKTVKIHVTHTIGSGGGAGMAGNVLVGGLIGAAVDAGSGAMYDLTPNHVNLNLEKEEAPAAQPAVAQTAPPAPTPPAAAPEPAPAAVSSPPAGAK